MDDHIHRKQIRYVTLTDLTGQILLDIFLQGNFSSVRVCDCDASRIASQPCDCECLELFHKFIHIHLHNLRQELLRYVVCIVVQYNRQVNTCLYGESN